MELVFMEIEGIVLFKRMNMRNVEKWVIT